MDLEVYPINRKVWQPLWDNYLGTRFDLGSNDGAIPQYECDTFICNAYDWDEDSEQEYNFYHIPSGYKLKWYKYAMRGASANMDITPEQFVDILVDCENAILSEEMCKEGVKLSYHCDKWWEELGCSTCALEGTDACPYSFMDKLACEDWLDRSDKNDV